MTHPLRHRPNILAHPSPTTGRFLLLVGALLGIGLLVGDLVHTVLLGSRWRAALDTCLDSSGSRDPLTGEVLQNVENSDLFAQCLAPHNQTRAIYSVVGALFIVVVSVMVVLAIPTLVRRRRKLRPATERMRGALDRIAELAAETGLRRPPRLLLGLAGQRDAFVFGFPGSYSIVLPTALVVRSGNRSLFDPVVRHELAHLRRNDVLLAWLAAAAWYATLPVLAVPLLLSVVRLDLSLLPPYVWRGGLMAGVVWLVRRQALRSREFDADLYAARQQGDWRPLSTVLQTGTGKALPWWKTLVSNHPTVAQRVAVLADPARVRGVSFVDGLAAAFLAASVLPIVLETAYQVTGGTDALSIPSAIAAVSLGPIMGLAVGVGLWRQALVDHVNGDKHWPGAVVIGVVLGLLLGHWAEIATVGIGGLESEAFTVFLTIVLGTGAVLLSASTGRLWADASSRLPAGKPMWWIGFLVNAVIFGLALWALQWLPITVAVAAAAGGGGLFLVVVAQLAAPATFLAAAVILVALVGIARRRKATSVPLWLLDSPQDVPATAAHEPGLGGVLLSGLIAGLLPAVGMAAHRLILGSPVSDDDRIARYLVWVSLGVFTALAVSMVSLIAVPRSGAAIGLVAGAITVVLGSFGMLAMNAVAFGNIFESKFLFDTISTIAALWFFTYLLFLPLSLAVWPASWRNVPGPLLTLLSVIFAGLPTLVVVAATYAGQA